LAVGLNFNFFTLFTELDPHIHMGGDNVIFWGPLSWAVIYGLLFATFLTLIMVPVMLLIVMKIKHKRQWKAQLREAREAPISCSATPWHFTPTGAKWRACQRLRPLCNGPSLACGRRNRGATRPPPAHQMINRTPPRSATR
jgi:hypothetical protein